MTSRLNRKEPETFREFTRDDTQAVKGIAILLMVWHHLFTMTEYIYEGWRPVYLVSLIDSFGCEGVMQLISYCGKLCVPIFFFLAGFGQWRGMEQRGTGFDTVGRLKKFYLSYWKVFMIFVPMAFLLFGHQNPFSSCYDVYANYSQFRLFPFIQSFLGISPVYNTEWWFILPYVICTALLPVWGAVIRKRSLTINLGLVLLLAVLFNLGQPFTDSAVWSMIFGQSKYCLCFFLGAVLAKDHAYEKLIAGWQKQGLDHLWIELPAVILLMLLRLAWCNDDAEMDLFFVPVLIMLFTLVMRRTRRISWLFRLYGRHSAGIWLFHTFLCYYFCQCQHLVYLPRYAVLILPWFMAICLGVSVLLKLFWSCIGKAAARVKKHG